MATSGGRTQRGAQRGFGNKVVPPRGGSLVLVCMCQFPRLSKHSVKGQVVSIFSFGDNMQPLNSSLVVRAAIDNM